MSEPDCQCSRWVTQPEILASQGIARDYCGYCEVCGRHGHKRHFPGSSPSTGTWCPRHYRRLLWMHPMGWYGRRLHLVAIVGLLVANALWRA